VATPRELHLNGAHLPSSGRSSCVSRPVSTAYINWRDGQFAGWNPSGGDTLREPEADQRKRQSSLAQISGSSTLSLLSRAIVCSKRSITRGFPPASIREVSFRPIQRKVVRTCRNGEFRSGAELSGNAYAEKRKWKAPQRHPGEISSTDHSVQRLEDRNAGAEHHGPGKGGTERRC
jgi:hypothetical protein